MFFVFLQRVSSKDGIRAPNLVIKYQFLSIKLVSAIKEMSDEISNHQYLVSESSTLPPKKCFVYQCF